MRDIALGASPSFHLSFLRRIRRGVPAFIKGALRRQAENHFPTREARAYRGWISDRLKQRARIFPESAQPGLISVLTPVWNGSPVRYLETLANSIIAQNREGASEWVILDNGCTARELTGHLDALKHFPWVKLKRVENNLGIIGGLRDCLSRATGRYVLAVDADDYLYPDAFRVVTSVVRTAQYPALLYSDEDKVIGNRFFQPYLKPDWDPVLFLNSAYIAHLGVVDREKALELGAYSDPQTEGSPDWDLFLRFMLAGHCPVHIPEVLYSWRVHAHSTADDAASKSYVHSSQKAVLQRFLDSRPDRGTFTVEHSPLLNSAAHWRFARKSFQSKPLYSLILTADERGAGFVKASASPRTLLPMISEIAEADGLVQLIGEDVEIGDPDWLSEALTLFELHPDAVMIGGRVTNRRGTVTEGGQYFGFDGPCGNPNVGRSSLDPGYFGQMWKQRSVSAVSAQLAVVKARFLCEVLVRLPAQASLAYLGAWAGAHAYRTGKRIVYSPFLSGISDLDWKKLVEAEEESSFSEINADIIPDARFYSPLLCLQKPFGLRSA